MAKTMAKYFVRYTYKKESTKQVNSHTFDYELECTKSSIIDLEPDDLTISEIQRTICREDFNKTDAPEYWNIDILSCNSL